MADVPRRHVVSVSAMTVPILAVVFGALVGAGMALLTLRMYLTKPLYPRGVDVDDEGVEELADDIAEWWEENYLPPQKIWG